MITAADFREPAKTSRGNALERRRAFCRELFREGVECLLAGDVDTGETTLHDYTNATVSLNLPK